MTRDNYMIGQRVVYRGVICTIIKTPKDCREDDNTIWVDNPEKGYTHWVSIGNIRPLPGGQL